MTSECAESQKPSASRIYPLSPRQRLVAWYTELWPARGFASGVSSVGAAALLFTVPLPSALAATVVVALSILLITVQRGRTLPSRGVASLLVAAFALHCSLYWLRRTGVWEPAGGRMQQIHWAAAARVICHLAKGAASRLVDDVKRFSFGFLGCLLLASLAGDAVWLLAWIVEQPSRLLVGLAPSVVIRHTIPEGSTNSPVQTAEKLTPRSPSPTTPVRPGGCCRRTLAKFRSCHDQSVAPSNAPPSRFQHFHGSCTTVPTGTGRMLDAVINYRRGGGWNLVSPDDRPPNSSTEFPSPSIWHDRNPDIDLDRMQASCSNDESCAHYEVYGYATTGEKRQPKLDDLPGIFLCYFVVGFFGVSLSSLLLLNFYCLLMINRTFYWYVPYILYCVYYSKTPSCGGRRSTWWRSPLLSRQVERYFSYSLSRCTAKPISFSDRPLMSERVLTAVSHDVSTPTRTSRPLDLTTEVGGTAPSSRLAAVAPLINRETVERAASGLDEYTVSERREDAYIKSQQAESPDLQLSPGLRQTALARSFGSSYSEVNPSVCTVLQGSDKTEATTESTRETTVAATTSLHQVRSWNGLEGRSDNGGDILRCACDATAMLGDVSSLGMLKGRGDYGNQLSKVTGRDPEGLQPGPSEVSVAYDTPVLRSDNQSCNSTSNSTSGMNSSWETDDSQGHSSSFGDSTDPESYSGTDTTTPSTVPTPLKTLQTRRSINWKSCLRRFKKGKYAVSHAAIPRILPSAQAAATGARRPVLFVYHPHGILGIGAYTTFAFENSCMKQAFPDLESHLCTLNVTMNCPFTRDWFLLGGFISVGQKSIDYVLRKKRNDGKTNAVTVVVGGASEALLTRENSHDIILKRRKGVFRTALKHGCRLIPVYGFGENEVFKVISTAGLAQKISALLMKIWGVALPFFGGVGTFQSRFGFFPRPTKLHVVFGRPIDCTQQDETSPELISKLQDVYLQELRNAFNSHKRFLCRDPTVEDLRVVA